MERERTGGMAHLARRLGEDGVLRDDLTVAEASDILWVLCSFETFDSLYTGRGLSVQKAAALAITLAERSLYR